MIICRLKFYFYDEFKDDREQFKRLENEVAFLKKELQEANSTILHYKQQLTNDLDKSTQSQSREEEKRSELDKKKEKLQQRLTELEPLPELLKNTELKLHDAMKKLKEHEQRNQDQSRLIENLQKKLEQAEQDNTTELQDTLKSSARKSVRRTEGSDVMIGDVMLSARSTNKDLGSNERFKELEDENHDLFRQLTLKDDALRDANVFITRMFCLAYHRDLLIFFCFSRIVWQ